MLTRKSWWSFVLLSSLVAIAQSLSFVQLFATPWTAEGSSVLLYLLESAQIHVHRVGDAI